MALLDVLGAPDFKPLPLDVVEDHVHWLLSHEWTKRWAGNMLQSSFRISGADRLANLTAALRPRCKLAGVVLDVIFQLRSQVLVALQPVHCAVLLTSASLVRKLLSVAKNLGTLSDYTTDSHSTEGQHHTTVSPLFLAVLFADQYVVDVLRCHGACFNGVDALATMRLQAVFLWADLEERLNHLQLGAEAEKLAQKVDELRRQAAEQVAEVAAANLVVDVLDM